MKSSKLLFALLGFLAFDASAECNTSSSPFFCRGKLEHLWTITTGQVYTNVQRGSDNGLLRSNLILDPTFLGTSRFERIYSLMLGAVHRDAAVYLEFDGSNRITTFAVYNPDVMPND